MADESHDVGASDAAVGFGQRCDAASEGDEGLVGHLVVHDRPESVRRGDAQVRDGVEQRVGPLVAQKERLGFVARAPMSSKSFP